MMTLNQEEATEAVMGLRDDLHRRLDQLEEGELPSVADFIGYLEIKHSPKGASQAKTEEDRAWLDATAEGMANRLASIESELPSARVRAWEEATSAAMKPARYVPGRGLVVGTGE